MPTSSTLRRPKKTSATPRYDERELMKRVAEVCRGLTLREQEERFGLSRESIRRYGLGHVSPSLPYIARICLETGVSAEWLLFGTGPRMAADRATTKKHELKQV